MTNEYMIQFVSNECISCTRVFGFADLQRNSEDI